jgi:hypothetical protein
MLHDLLVEIKLDKFACYRNLETSAIEAACSEIDVAQLQTILQKYVDDDDDAAVPARDGAEHQADRGHGQGRRRPGDGRGRVQPAPRQGAPVLPLPRRGLQVVVQEDRAGAEPAATFSEFQLDSPCVGKTFKEWYKQVAQPPSAADAPVDVPAPSDASADAPAP